MTKNANQSFAGVLRERLDYLNERMHFGISQKVLVDQLEKEGFVMSMATFRETLHRVRKERKAADAAKTGDAALTSSKSQTVTKAPNLNEAAPAAPIIATVEKPAKFKMLKLDKKDIY